MKLPWIFLFFVFVSSMEISDEEEEEDDDDDTYSGSTFSPTSCVDPGSILNARRKPAFNHNGVMPDKSQLHFSCFPGYFLDGSSKMECQSGTWKPFKKPICRRVSCPIPQVSNGEVQRSSESIGYYPGNIIQVTCNEGYRLKTEHDNNFFECDMKGSWVPHTQSINQYRNDEEIFTCVDITCTQPPPFVPNSDRNVNGKLGWDANYTSGSVVTYQCHKGFQMEDIRGSRLVCRSGKWQSEYDDVPLSSCALGGCSRPLPILNGNFAPHRQSVHPYGSIVTYFCYPDYSLVSQQSYTFQCLSDGTWSPGMREENLPHCRYQTESNCEEPSHIENGHMHINGTGAVDDGHYHENTAVYYTCKSGYRFHDCSNNWIICKNGLWMNNLPKCVELNGCGQPPAVPFALITYNDPTMIVSGDANAHHSFPFFSKIRYKCQPAFTLLGTPDLTCGIDGCWLPNVPQCTLLGPSYGSSDLKTLIASADPPQTKTVSWSDTHLMMVSVATAGGIIGALLLIQLLVVIQKRKCFSFLFHRRRSRARRQNAHLRSRRRSSTASSLVCHTPNYDPDRVALIAFADGVQVVLPTYEEAMRQSGSLPPNWSGHSLISNSQVTSQSLGDGIDTQDITTSGVHQHTTSSFQQSGSGAESLGSSETVATSEASTAITLETLNSTASNSSPQPSNQAICGSVASSDATSLITCEGAPLLDDADREEEGIAGYQANDNATFAVSV